MFVVMVHQGCLPELEKAVKDNVGIVAGAGIGLAVVEVSLT